MDLHLSGKTAVVTGGSRGIGLATVRLLLAEGMRVVSGSRTLTPELAATEAVPVLGDLATPDGPTTLIERAVAEFGGVDLLVNNVGIGDTDDIAQGVVHTVADLPDSAWERTFDLHFYAALRATRAALPSLVERRGTIVTVSTMGARMVTSGPFHYNVAKAALNALTRATADQFGAAGVRAVTVSPGPVSTGVWTDPDGLVGRLAAQAGTDVDALSKQLIDSMGVTTGRITTPEEVARLIAFAASPNNFTGTDFLVDGGTVKAA